jgi:two-component system, chemotaxis family, response regulator Rcp1
MTSLTERGRAAEILLVEDSDSDAELARLGLERAKLAVNLHRVTDGVECMAYLRNQGQYASVPMPDLILLDLNMPRMDGHEVLAEISKDERLRHLPVVVLTSSMREQEMLESYRLRCSSFIVKPVDFDQFARVIRSVTSYWFTVVVLPETAKRPAEPAAT